MATSPEQPDEQARVYGRIVARAWTDDGFKQRVLADPTAVLKAEGLDVPDGTELRVLEDSDAVLHVALPAKGDDAFRQRLLADPAAVLKSNGMQIPEGTEVRVVEDTDTLLHLTLPAKPAQLSDEQLTQVAGGITVNHQFTINYQFGDVDAHGALIRGWA